MGVGGWSPGLSLLFLPTGEAVIRRVSVCGFLSITPAVGKQNHYDASVSEPGSGPHYSSASWLVGSY